MCIICRSGMYSQNCQSERCGYRCSHTRRVRQQAKSAVRGKCCRHCSRPRNVKLPGNTVPWGPGNRAHVRAAVCTKRQGRRFVPFSCMRPMRRVRGAWRKRTWTATGAVRSVMIFTRSCGTFCVCPDVGLCAAKFGVVPIKSTCNLPMLCADAVRAAFLGLSLKSSEMSKNDIWRFLKREGGG